MYLCWLAGTTLQSEAKLNWEPLLNTVAAGMAPLLTADLWSAGAALLLECLLRALADRATATEGRIFSWWLKRHKRTNRNRWGFLRLSLGTDPWLLPPRCHWSKQGIYLSSELRGCKSALCLWWGHCKGVDARRDKVLGPVIQSITIQSIEPIQWFNNLKFWGGQILLYVVLLTLIHSALFSWVFCNFGLCAYI